MDHAERVLELIAERGFLVLLAPAYLGYPDPHYPGFGNRSEGWYDEVVANGVGRQPALGRIPRPALRPFRQHHVDAGRRPEPRPRRSSRSMPWPTACAAPGSRRHSPPTSTPRIRRSRRSRGADWLDVNPTYTYGIVHRKLIDDWNRDPAWPFFLIESTYEGEHDASELQIRRQAWWSVLCGANGHLIGNKPMWLFGDGWQDQLRSPASIAMARWGDFLRDLPWWDLQPDESHAFATAGLGEARGLDRVTAAVSTAADLAVAYLPVRRPLTIEPVRLGGGPLAVEWFEPATGQRIRGAAVSGAAGVVLEPPFAEDSVLTVRRDG